MASQQTSSTLMSTHITRARSYLNEATASFWTDAELLIWGNDGTLDIVARTHCLESIETEQLIVNTMSYALASPFLFIRAVVYTQAAGVERGLIKGNLQSIGHVKGSGEPIYWCQERDNVVVYPKPDASHSGAGFDIDVYTVTRPTAIAASETVLVPACYDNALTMYIAAQGFLKDSQFGRAELFMRAYYAELDRYRQDFVLVPKETVAVVK